MEDVQTASNAVSDTAMPEANAVPSISDALSKAFDTVNQTTDTQTAAPASDGPSRAPDGKFAPKAAETPAQEQEQPAAPEAPATAAAPPARFVKAAQEAWAQAPEIIRAEVARMESELTQGLQKYKESAEAFEPLRQFDAMAKQGGTTLADAVTGYVTMENLLRADPVKGMLAVCQNLGVDPAQMAQALAGQQVEGGNSPHVAALEQKIAQLEQKLSGVAQSYQEIELRPVTQQVEDFASKNPLFNYVADDIAKNIAAQKAAGQKPDLGEAYKAALALHPHLAAVAAQTAAPAAPTPTTPDPAQTRKASLSITGSPSVSNTSTRKPAGSTREALDSAFASVGL
jgi:hypothetical protein